VVEDLQTKCGINERGCRALTLNSRHHNEPERPQESSTARHRDNRKVGRENLKKEHRRQGHNSSGSKSSRQLRMIIAEPLFFVNVQTLFRNFYARGVILEMLASLAHFTGRRKTIER
jgi:hypothetical protein